MNNSLIKTKESLWEKIKNKIKSLFKIKNKEENIEKDVIVDNARTSVNLIHEELKVDINTEKIVNDYQKKEFIEILKKNPECLKELSINQLDILNDYLIKDNEAKRAKLEELKKKNN